MASASTSATGGESSELSRKPSKLVARSNTLHRSPHSHSGSGAGLWLANSPTSETSTFADAVNSHADQPLTQPADSQPATSSSQQDGAASGHAKKVYHFSAELARASFGGRPLTLGGGSRDYDPIYTNKQATAPSDDDGDVDLDLSFDYISRFDRSSSSSKQQDSSGPAFDSSAERDTLPPPTSHFSPDDTPESFQASESPDVEPATPPKSALAPISSPSHPQSSATGSGTSPSPSSKAIRSMRANAVWDKRKKAPPAPLTLTPGSEAKRQRQLAMQKPQHALAEKSSLPSLSTRKVGPTIELPPLGQELVGKSIFSPITPATDSIPFRSNFGASHASEEPLPLTPLSATRRGAAINRVLPQDDGSSITADGTSGSHACTPDSAAIRRAASTSTARAMAKQSSEALRRTPTAAAAHSPSYASNVTPMQTRRPRSQSNRSFRASASLASLGPPRFPPPNEPLPSPALSPSFQEHSLPSTSAYHTANDANSVLSKAGRSRPSASSIDYSEAARSLRSRTTQTGRSSLDSFRTANSDGMAVTASSHSIHDGRRWASGDGSQPPPLPPLQRYEALFPNQPDRGNAQHSQSIGAVTSATTASTLTSMPMVFSSTVGSTATTAMTWSMSDQSTPSTHQSPFTPFTPAFSDMMPGTATTSKTHFTAITRPSISSEMPHTGEAQSKTVVHTDAISHGGAAATLKEASDDQEQGRGKRNTEQWILTQRQRKALLQQEELASQQRLLDADQEAMRLSIRADERISRVVPSLSVPPTTTAEDSAQARSRQDSRSTDATDDDQHAKIRQTLVISTASTPDESVDPFHFVTGQPSLMPASGRDTGAAAMGRAASHNALESSSTKGALPMTRNRSGTTGPWPQSPLLLNFNLQGEGKAPTQDSVVSPALTTIINSVEATPEIDGHLDSERYGDVQHNQAVQGLGLDIDYPSTHVGTSRDTSKGFAPVTTDLLRKASRYMDQHAQDAASPHLSIQMSPDIDALQRTRSKSREALLTRGSGRHEELNQDVGFDLASGPSPLLPNDCRSPRTVSGKEVGSSGPGGLNGLVTGALQTDMTVHRAQVTTANRTIGPSQSIASSISAFVYNATPAPTPAAAEADTGRHLDVPAKPKTGSIGWRRNARRSRDTPAQTLGQGMRPDKHLATDSADVKFVNIDLDDGGLETEVTLGGRDEANKSGDSAKGGQWVSKLWNAVSSPRRTSFNLGAAPGDRSVDLELANSSTGEQSKDQDQAPAPVSKSARTASRGSFRPLSLVEKRQSSGKYQLEAARQRFRSPTPGEEDEVAEKDARAVALRLLAGSPRIPPPVEEGAPSEEPPKQSLDRADLSAEEREKERIEALKKLRRMSAVERQRKRSSGIGYITSASNTAGSPRLTYITDKSNDVEEAHGPDASVRHGGLSRVASLNKSSNNKRMSLTVFGGKERAGGLTEAAAPTGLATGAPERAWLDAMRSPRVAESPSGFTPRMTFDPQDWSTGLSSQQQRHGRNHAAAAPSSAANHIPLMLSNSALSRPQASGPGVESVQDHGLTVSELNCARDEMRRLAGQGMAFKEDELAHDAVETYHTPMPAQDTWTYGAEQHDHHRYVHEEGAAELHAAGQHQTTELGDFGISPEKKPPRLHRRTRTARFADEDHHQLYEHEYEQDPPTVSIFTRSQQHRHRASGNFSVQFGSHTQPPVTEERSRSKRRASHYAGADGGGHSLFATPAALLEGNTPSKNMFWAGFLGMPWLWMIGGWYLTPDGQLRHPSADDPRLRRKVDVWQHEPSMQGQGSANSSPNLGSSSTTFGASSYEQSWAMGQAGESGSATGLGLDMRNGAQSAMSFAASSTGTFNSAKTTTSDPNMPPPSKTRKSKTRSFGTLLDANPQVSFYQSPVRVVQEPQPSFGNVWRSNQGMEPLLEMEEPRRSRLFAGYPDENDHDRAYTASPAVSSSEGSTAVSAAEARGKTASGYQVAVATKTRVATPWKDLESQRQPRVDDDDDNDGGSGGGQKETKRGLTSWDAVRWLSSHATPNGSPTRQPSKLPPAATQEAPLGAGNSSMLLAGAAAALAATSSAATTTALPGGLGGLLTALLNPTVPLPSTKASTAAQQRGADVMLSTFNHLVFLRAIFRVIFRVIVLVRLARFRNSAMPISALVLNELLG
ncbi:hypothetical protein EX895_006451 [Sporisorium graminicola]|uniref:Uncharacterized protein n=1 Tax=Sporisorium graminicola TaxID=280036 RepID=A0A4V6ET02_9BASI|nr:hypothetical protein EX895_006451 [Sporisorium graminicola]TKY84549.1 hypothetical protein EX895_006451 [Sporisorium graminicola]